MIKSSNNLDTDVFNAIKKENINVFTVWQEMSFPLTPDQQITVAHFCEGLTFSEQLTWIIDTIQEKGWKFFLPFLSDDTRKLFHILADHAYVKRNPFRKQRVVIRIPLEEYIKRITALKPVQAVAGAYALRDKGVKLSRSVERLEFFTTKKMKRVKRPKDLVEIHDIKKFGPDVVRVWRRNDFFFVFIHIDKNKQIDTSQKGAMGTPVVCVAGVVEHKEKQLKDTSLSKRERLYHAVDLIDYYKHKANGC